jgi:PAS domain S-box-containing protein
MSNITPADREEFYRLTLEAMADAVLLTDDAGRFRYICPNAERSTGIPVDEIAALGSIDCLFDRDPAAALPAARNASLTNIPVAIKTRGGREQDLLVNVSRVDIAGSSRLYVARGITDFNLSATLLDRIFYHSADAIVIVHPTDRTIVKCNPATSTLLGYQAHELIGQSTEMIYVDHASFMEFARSSAASIENRGFHRGEHRLKHRAGHAIAVQISTVPVSSHAGDQFGFVSLINDISDRRRADDAISMINTVVRETAGVERTDGVFEAVLEAICRESGWQVGEAWVRNGSGSTAAFERSAYWAMELAGLAYIDAGGGSGAAAARSWAALAGDGRSPVLIRDLRQHPANSDPHLQIAVAAGLHGACAVPLVVGDELEAVMTFFMQEVRVDCEQWLGAVSAALLPFSALIQRLRSEQILRQREAEIRRSHEDLRKLAQRLENLREKERKEIARELHDQMGSDLTGLKIDLQFIREGMPASDNKQIRCVEAAEALVDSMVGSMRAMATRLRPAILDVYGLAAGIEWLLNDFERRSGCAVTATLADSDPAPDETSVTVLFRICQEALTNILRHAAATRVSVHLGTDNGNVVLTIDDDGKGIDDSALRTSQRLGIVGMRERARAIGGRLRITERKDGGTCVRVTVPLRHNDSRSMIAQAAAAT